MFFIHVLINFNAELDPNVLFHAERKEKKILEKTIYIRNRAINRYFTAHKKIIIKTNIMTLQK